MKTTPLSLLLVVAATLAAAPAALGRSINITGNGGWEAALARARHAVAQLDLAEKVNLTTGIGSVGRCEGTLGRVDKLGIPELCFQDGPTGVRASDFVTVFPAGVTTAATFNRDLFEARAEAMAAEFRAKGIHVLLGPVTGGPLGRSPYQGRNWEGFGADPFLVGEAAYRSVRGIQSQGVIATAKHFLVYEQETFRQLYAADDPWTLNPENNTVNTYSANVDDRTMHDLYLRPFQNAVRAGAGCIMCVYNQINGTQGCEAPAVIGGLLKDELDFQGFVVSDWSAVFNTTPAVNAGVDVIMPGGATTGGYRNQVGGPALLEAVRDGQVDEARVDDMVTRFLTQYYLRNQDKDYPAVNYKDGYMGTYLNGTRVNEHRNVQANHAAVARDINEEAITVVFNHKRALPLSKRSKVAIFGSDAATNPYGINGCEAWIGAGSNLCPGNRTTNGTNAMGWGSGAGYFPYLIDPAAGLQEHVRAVGSFETNFNDYDLTGENLAQIERFAQISDVALVFVQARSGEDSDRTSLALEANGDELIARVAAQNNNTIVVAHIVGPTYLDAVFDNENVSALVLPHLPGQESGNTLARVLYGDVNPSGKVPYSILRRDDASHYPNITRQSAADGTIPVDFTEGVFVDYRKFDRDGVTPLVHFGHGVSYTTFDFGATSAQAAPAGDYYPTEVPSSSNKKAPGGPNSLWEYVATVESSVSNTGSRDGKEVAQLYLSFPDSVKGVPKKQLAGFEKVHVAKGQTEKVAFQLTRRDFAIWSVEKQEYVVPDGEYTVRVGASADDDQLRSSAKLTMKDGRVSS
ncbi:hypothetical protein FA10DRAFT_281476 [Acaromyces ingoldii]|uniref:beta-glucosidase n=1 Tax=Acaromyces ingoldii TaxID=215250 RepID=A0A316YH87_9BASI|nr:hypothetical protein FA10DRAFT_281476 [Acaromyces ingoldii]PWN87978.1 hypothetical protein FA10DRAFT_281476 [Acaromyces ingoldii]